MAALSDHLLVVAILGYALAMLASAAEYAFGNRGAVARVAVRQRELVGAGAGGPSLPADGEEPVDEAEVEAGRVVGHRELAAADLVGSGHRGGAAAIELDCQATSCQRPSRWT